MTFDIQDPAWAANSVGPDRLGLSRTAAPLGNLDFLRVHEIIESPCGGPSETVPPVPSPADLLTTLQGLGDYLTVTDPTTVLVGGYTGRQVDVTVSDGALAACGGPIGGAVSILATAGEVWNASPGERFSLIFVPVDGQALTIAVSTDWTQTPSVQELGRLVIAAQQVIDSVRF